VTHAPHVPSSDTSRAAAAAIEPKLPAKEYAVWRFIVERGYVGATDDELEREFVGRGWATPTARARRVRLCEKGLLRDSGGRRLTRHKRLSVVWIPAEVEPDLFAGREWRGFSS
jgi:hypothetical protein